MRHGIIWFMEDLTPAQATALHEHIAAQRQRTLERIAALESQFDDIVESSADSVRDDEHDPEGATIAFERAQVASLLAAARGELVALDAAAQRLHDDPAGRCEHCGQAIGPERLMARPSATRCVTCATSGRP
jgi:RNA polymerase-binding transcription factor DksA